MYSEFFVSIDWGTSNLRIKLVASSSLLMVEEINSSEGIKKVYNDWRMIGGDRETHFIKLLQLQLNRFITKIDPLWPIVISGMASSSIGLRELPYANLPVQLNGESFYVESIESILLPNKIILIAGAKSDSDVMRGEETQILGLVSNEDFLKKTLFILPGTHSKHIITEKGLITDVKTFMTGEIFSSILEHTILKDSLKDGEFYLNEQIAFCEGVNKAKEGVSLLHSLFAIRTNTLFHKKTPTENYFYLSGLLIGDEISTVVSLQNHSIQLATTGKLCELYGKAFEVLDLLPTATIIEKYKVDSAVLHGQWKIVNNLFK